MAKEFIAFLGTGNYGTCKYGYDNSVIETSYIQEALIKMFCCDFTKEDSIKIFITDYANKENWLNCDKKQADGTMKENIGLQQRLAKLNLQAKIESISIPEGKSEVELWKIFQIVMDNIQPSDSILFDVTHGFRTLPLFGIAILYYAYYLKQIQISGIYYGAYEARDENNKAPIFNLTSVFNLMRWTSAADAFMHYGSSKVLSELVKETARENAGSKQAATSISEITNIMATVRGKDIIEADCFINCNNKINDLKKSGTYQAPFEPLFEQILNVTNQFKQDDPYNFITATQWYLDNNMIPQGFTMLQEGILTYILCRVGLDYTNFQLRDITRGQLFEKSKKQPTNISLDLQKKYSKEISKIALDPILADVSHLFDNIRFTRNNINHGGFMENQLDAPTLKNQLKLYLSQTKEFCAKYPIS